MDALRGYPGGAAVFATHAGQTIQQPALYAAQLQAVAQQQQQQAAAQLAAVQQQQQQLQQQQQQQQQSLINGIPAGCMLVRTATGGYALLAQAPAATNSAALQAQAQSALGQQQYITVNANGQATAANGRMAMFTGPGGQQMMYQYTGQPTIQAGPTQYIQLSNNAGQVQQHPLSTSPVLQTAGEIDGIVHSDPYRFSPSVYPSQTATQYLSAAQAAGGNSAGSTSTNGHNTIGPSAPNGSQIQPTSTIISPQKQSAATATAAAMQQQQQYQHALSAQQQQQQQQHQQLQQLQQQQQQNANGAHGAGVYFAAISQAQAQLNAQMQAQQTAFAFAQQQQQQQQQQMSFVPQVNDEICSQLMLILIVSVPIRHSSGRPSRDVLHNPRWSNDLSSGWTELRSRPSSSDRRWNDDHGFTRDLFCWSSAAQCDECPAESNGVSNAQCNSERQCAGGCRSGCGRSAASSIGSTVDCSTSSTTSSVSKLIKISVCACGFFFFCSCCSC